MFPNCLTYPLALEQPPFSEACGWPRGAHVGGREGVREAEAVLAEIQTSQ